MPKSYKCSFCRAEVPFGTGLMYVKLDGSVLWFCSRRCKRSALDFGRSTRKMKWITKRKAP